MSLQLFSQFKYHWLCCHLFVGKVGPSHYSTSFKKNKEFVLRHMWQFLDIIISWLEHNSASILDFFLLNQNLEQCSNQAYSMQKCRCPKWITILKEFLQYIFIVYTCHQRISIWLLILYHTLKRLASYRTNAYFQ